MPPPTATPTMQTIDIKFNKRVVDFSFKYSVRSVAALVTDFG
jgi:hypothetical protein